MSAPMVTGAAALSPTDMQAARLREPIPCAPFLDWCAQREARIRADLDNYPRIDSGLPTDFNPHYRMLATIGWGDDNGARRYHRWRDENTTGLVERADVEEALFTAGVDFYHKDLYPDAPRPSVVVRLDQGARMTQGQLIAAHTVYMRGRLTISDVADLIWQRYGYANPEAARCAIRRGWRHLDLPRRQCIDTTAAGRCRKHPMSASDLCAKHDTTITFGWQPPAALIQQARDMYKDGIAFKSIGRLLIDQTPWQHPTYVAKRLAAIARDQGWNESGPGQRPPSQVAA